jgi:transcriptional regulator with GAF, ATPase, and Fis domain
MDVQLGMSGWDADLLEEQPGSEPSGAGSQGTENLLEAMTVALAALQQGGGEQERKQALRDSFIHARDGLRARKALLLYVAASRHDALDLQILHASGLTEEQARACQELQSGDGISPSVIRKVIDTRQIVFIPNAQAFGGDGTASLASGSHSVLCAPVIDRVTSAVLAVLYFQNQGLLDAFEETEARWLAAYATALGHAFGMHLSTELRLFALEQERARLAHAKHEAPEIVGAGESTRRIRAAIHETYVPEVVDRHPKPILILGPSGSGKDVIARYLHYYSSTRGRAAYVAYNCAGLRSGDMTKSILFGHLRGSFTGAIKDSPGLFRDAHKGVLFLDEIGEMPLDGQAELLRVIQDGRITPLGASHAVAVDVQLVTATNRDLEAEVRAGRFREDLFYRIGVHKIRLEPLTSAGRRGDVRPLLTHFLTQQEQAAKKKTGGLTPDALRALLAYTWPGNVRELENVCTVLVTYAKPGAAIELRDVQLHCPEVTSSRRLDAELLVDDDATFAEAELSWEREFLRSRLDRYDGNQTKAAKSLELHYSTLIRKMERCGLPGAMSRNE